MKDVIIIIEEDKRLARELSNFSQRPSHDGGCQGLGADEIIEDLANHRSSYAKLAVSATRKDWERDLQESVEGVEFALAQLRHLYSMMVNGKVDDNLSAASGLLAPQIVALERVYERVKKSGISPI